MITKLICAGGRYIVISCILKQDSLWKSFISHTVESTLNFILEIGSGETERHTLEFTNSTFHSWVIHSYEYTE